MESRGWCSLQLGLHAVTCSAAVYSSSWIPCILEAVQRFVLRPPQLLRVLAAIPPVCGEGAHSKLAEIAGCGKCVCCRQQWSRRALAAHAPGRSLVVHASCAHVHLAVFTHLHCNAGWHCGHYQASTWDPRPAVRSTTCCCGCVCCILVTLHQGRTPSSPAQFTCPDHRPEDTTPCIPGRLVVWLATERHGRAHITEE